MFHEAFRGFYVIYDTHMKAMQYGDESKSFRHLGKKIRLESLTFHIIPIEASKSEGSGLGNIGCLPITGH